MDLHRYDRDTGAYDSQSVIVFDTYEGGLYDSGALPNGCGKDSAIWGSPSFTSDDAWFIHQKCTGTPESYSNANYLTSRNEAGDLIETALNDYSSILPVATPGDEYHVDAYLEFRSRDSIDEAGGELQSDNASCSWKFGRDSKWRVLLEEHNVGKLLDFRSIHRRRDCQRLSTNYIEAR